MAVGWSTTDKVNVTVSGGNNLTATGTGPGGTVRSITSRASGKWYAELTLAGTIDTSSDIVWGLANGAYNLYGYPGAASPSNSVGIAVGDVQEIIYNDIWVGWQTPPGPSSAGHVISVCFDASTGAVWFLTPSYISLYGASAWNANTSADPATGSGGIPTSFASPYHLAFYGLGNTGSGTLNTGGSAFARTPPAGFAAWDTWTTAQVGSARYNGAGVLAANPSQRRPMVGLAKIGAAISTVPASTNPFTSEFSGEFGENGTVVASAGGVSAIGGLTTSPYAIAGRATIGPLTSKVTLTNLGGIVGTARIGPIASLGVTMQSDLAAGIGQIGTLTSLIGMVQTSRIGTGIGTIGPLVGKGTMTGAAIALSGSITIGPVKSVATIVPQGAALGRGMIGPVSAIGVATTNNVARGVVRLGALAARGTAVAGNGVAGIGRIGPLRGGGRLATKVHGPKSRDSLIIASLAP